MSEPAQPQKPGSPIQVTECRGCGSLFAVYDTQGDVACPVCSAKWAVAGLEIVELGIGRSVEVTVEAEPSNAKAATQTPAMPELDSLTSLLPETSPEPQAKNAADEPASNGSVAEWLTQSEPPRTDPLKRLEPTPEPYEQADLAAEPETTTAPPNSAPTLAESLGWRAEDFGAKLSEATSADSDPKDSPTEPEAPTNTEDFGFDFGATALTSAGSESMSDGTLDLQVGDDEHVNIAREIVGDSINTESDSRSWAGPLTVAATLIAIGAGAIYLVAPWDADQLNSAAITGFEPDQRISEAPTNEAPGTDFSLADSAPPAFDTESPSTDPIRDPAAEPASFEAPIEEASEVEDRYAQADPPADPFLANPPALALPTEETPAEVPAAGDRYASLPTSPEPTFNQPESFAAAEFETPAPETVEGATPPLEPVARTPEPVIEVPESDPVGLVNAPTYTTADLAEALAMAEPAARGFTEGTLSDPEQVSLMGQHYARLCYLAQILTLVDPTDSDPRRLATELQSSDLLSRVFRGNRPREESRQIAGPWVNWTGRPHGGVFFAGIPVEMTSVGEVIEYQFDLGEAKIPVVMPEEINPSRFLRVDATDVGIFGVVVENPREWIAGYQGDSERVVWARKSLALRRPEEL